MNCIEVKLSTGNCTKSSCGSLNYSPTLKQIYHAEVKWNNFFFVFFFLFLIAKACCRMHYKVKYPFFFKQIAGPILFTIRIGILICKNNEITESETQLVLLLNWAHLDRLVFESQCPPGVVCCSVSCHRMQ